MDEFELLFTAGAWLPRWSSMTRARVAAAAVARSAATTAERLCVGFAGTSSGSGAGASGRNSFRYISNRSSSRFGTGILLRAIFRRLLSGCPARHGFAQFGERVAVARGCGIWAELQKLGNFEKGQLAPNVQDHDLALVVGNGDKGAAKVCFGGEVLLGRAEPGGFGIERYVALKAAGVVEDGIAHAGEQVGFPVGDLLQVCVLDQLQKHLVDSILRTAAVAGDGRGEEQERRTVPAVKRLNFGYSGASVRHDAVSMIRHSRRLDLSIWAPFEDCQRRCGHKQLREKGPFGRHRFRRSAQDDEVPTRSEDLFTPVQDGTQS